MSRSEIRHTDSEKSSLLCAEFDSALFAFCEIQVCVFVNSSLPYGKLSLHRQKNEVWVFKNSSLRFFENSSLYQKNKGVGHWSTCEKRKTVQIIIENSKTEINFDQN